MIGNTKRRTAGCLQALLLAYLALLLASHAVRLLRPAPPPTLDPGEFVVELGVWDGPAAIDERVDVVYRERAPEAVTDPPAVLLIHGSPGRKEDFHAIIPLLAERYRVVAPDLPGFGKSPDSVPDYSIEAHARYLLDMMNRLGVGEAHLVGFSMGGGVGLQLYNLAPERVRSLTLLSAIGVQELELLGGYHVNHLIHGAQLAGLWLLREGFPHFGYLDGAFFGVAYARNFYDSDQRPLREILSRFDRPMLIVHGRRDVLVPPAAAREHHRLVPHSELQLLEANHFFVFMRGGPTGQRIVDFLDRVERGEAASRRAATPDRLLAASQPFDPTLVPPAGGLTLVVMILLIALATLLSEDLACIVAGLLASQGRISFLAAVVACFVGIFVGDLLLYLAGRFIGRPALRRAPLKWIIRPERVEVSSRWFDRRGPIVIGLSRFVPGTRLPTYFAAGVLHTSFWRFCVYFFLAVALWTPALVGASMMLGGEVLRWVELAGRYGPLALLATALLVFAIVKLVVPLFSFRGRRLLVSSFRRKLRWEFWPPWAFYPPVLAYTGWLALKHRSPLLFTAANPAIEAGGFIHESKAKILRGLSNASDFVARFRLIPGDAGAQERLARVMQFLQDERLRYPVVLKPDAGQRGSGVVVARDENRLRPYVERATFDFLVQEYVPGREFGIFYYRYPGQERGRILSITEKRMPVLAGDGKRTLEQLILCDPRAVCLAPLYLSNKALEPGRVPCAGEHVQLVELGTHCRGAVFLDGHWLETPALADVIDRISRGYRGFYIGRYDVRTPSIEDLKQGRNFKIVELNGVTSEATHIYDPKFGLLDAYRVLFEQCRITFEIGRQNRERGARPSRLTDLARLLAAYRRTASLHPR